MFPRRLLACAMLCGVALPAAADGVITFRVPVTLQNLHPEITKFRVHCALPASYARAETVVPVVDRAYNGIVEVKVKFSDSEWKVAHGYACSLAVLWGTNVVGVPTQEPTPKSLHVQAKPGTPFRVSVEGPLAGSVASAEAGSTPVNVAPPTGSAAPAWGQVGTTPAQPPGPAASAPTSRGPVKSALPGGTSGK